jgi:sec-independent protein translocase protein TatA
MLAEIIGPDIMIILAIVAVLFGGSQIPKFARSLGSAQKEFKRGIEEGSAPTEIAANAETDAK